MAIICNKTISPHMDHKKAAIWKEIILGYRRLIQERYDYKLLQERFDLPWVLNEPRVNQFVNYLLVYPYPLPEKREILNKAFASLDNYLKHPSRLLRILIDSRHLIIRYGRHLPKILNRGIQVLQSFRTASDFEMKLLERALLLKVEAPFGTEIMERLLKTIPQKELEEFIDSGQILFQILQDKVLVTKVIEIIQFLIRNMKKHRDFYSDAEIKGLELGLEIIVEGDLLFNTLSPKEQEQIYQFVLRVERDSLSEIFSV